MKQTKAQRLFNNAYREAREAVEFWAPRGTKIDALSSLHDGTDEIICKRTVNAIRKLAEQRLRAIDQDVRFGVCEQIDGYDPEARREAVRIVLRTCDNWERDEAEFMTRIA